MDTPPAYVCFCQFDVCGWTHLSKKFLKMFMSNFLCFKNTGDPPKSTFLIKIHLEVSVALLEGIKGNISFKHGHDRGQSSKNLIEAEEIKRRWQEYTEELYKKCLNDPDTHDGVVTQLEPDNLECVDKSAFFRKHYYKQS